MPPKAKMDPRSKAEAKKAEAEAQKQAQARVEAERREAESWAVGAKSNKKGEREEEKDAEKRRKAAEKAALQAEEDAELGKIASKPKSKKKGKDDFDLLNAALANQPKNKAQKEAEARKKAEQERRKKEAVEQKKKQEAKKAEEDYIKKQAAKGIVMNHAEELMVPINNTLNDGEGEDGAFLEATGIDSAMSALSTSGGSGAGGTEKVDLHPEKRRKALYNAYREAQLPIVKESHPGLRLSQYNDLIFNNWKRAPENPDNQIQKQTVFKVPS